MRNELRQDPLTKNWVIIAAGRSKRPHDITKPGEKTPLPKGFRCPFCPQEEKRNIELFRIESSPGAWVIRSILNKNPYFEAPSSEETGILFKSDLFPSLSPVGHAEVLVETPDHFKDLVFMEREEIERVILTYKFRHQDLFEKWQEITIFRNHGYLAGQSLFHPHSQITATTIKSPEIKEEEISFLEYFYKTNHCLLCDMIKMEKIKKKRIVKENEHFIALCPWASMTPYEITIVPKRHESIFFQIKKEEISALASLLQEILRKMYIAFADPSYNFYIRSFAAEKPFYKKFRTRHFYLKIIFHLSIPGGFEASTEAFVNSVSPEAATDHLKNIEVSKINFQKIYSLYSKNPNTPIEKLLKKFIT